jgi:hypothetical protein
MANTSGILRDSRSSDGDDVVAGPQCGDHFAASRALGDRYVVRHACLDLQNELAIGVISGGDLAQPLFWSVRLPLRLRCSTEAAPQ